jgi:hypothetical protein
MEHRAKIIAWGVGLGLLIGTPVARADEEKVPNVTLEADHEPLLSVIKKICATQGLGFVANDQALDKAGRVSLSLHDIPLEQALEVICEAYSLEAHLRGRILVVRPRDAAATTSEALEPHPRRGNRFMPEEPKEAPPESPRSEPPPERGPTPLSSETAPVSSIGVHTATTVGGGQYVVGTVVEVGRDSIKVKEASGDPVEFFVATGVDDNARSSRLTVALRRLKVGDRIALEYRVVEGRPCINSLIGGGDPQGKP